MGRAPCCEKAGLKRGRWTAEEDDILTKYIQANGEGKWRSLPKNAGLLRCGKSCRLRWVNYLKSDLKRGNFSTDEDETIIKLHSSLGNRWCLIASHLPGRTDNEIKNYWNSHLSRQIYNYRKIIKELKQQVVVHQPPKLGSSDIAPRSRVGGTSTRSAIKKKKSKFPTTLPNPTLENLVEKSIEATISSKVDNGGDTILMPSTPALEENVMSSMLSETMDDIFLDFDFSDMEFDGLEAGPAEVPNFQTSSPVGDQMNGEIVLFTNVEVEYWLMGDNTTMQLESELNISSNAENGDPPSFYPNDDLDNLGWDWDNLDFVDGVSDMVFDGLEAGPAEVPNLQTSSPVGDQMNREILFTNDEVQYWLMGDYTTMQLESELNISSNAGNGDPPSFYPNDDLDNLVWDCDNLDFVDGDVQGEKLWDSEEEKLLSGLWEISSEKDDDGDCIGTTE